MKYLITCVLAGITFFSHGQHQLVKLWETQPVFAIPESVLPDVRQKTLYVSIINGSPSQADGKGGIGKLSLNGKKIDTLWVSGLNAPKGMGMYEGRLYVADLSEVVVINTRTGKIEQKIPVPDARVLNDLTIDNKGIIYVSDSATGKIHRIESGKAAVYIENVSGINGLKSIGNDLYMLIRSSVQKAAADKSVVQVAGGLAGGLDGIEPVGNGDLLVSSFNGVLYYVYASGKFDILLDTRTEKMNTADFGYDAKKKILYVPTFSKRTVAAFSLK